MTLVFWSSQNWNVYSKKENKKSIKSTEYQSNWHCHCCSIASILKLNSNFRESVEIGFCRFFQVNMATDDRRIRKQFLSILLTSLTLTKLSIAQNWRQVKFLKFYRQIFKSFSIFHHIKFIVYEFNSLTTSCIHLRISHTIVSRWKSC